jgi:DNA-binding IclR family transcriptional regulator
LGVEDEELLAGRRTIAAVVVDGEGAVIAAVELAVPAQAYPRERLLKELGPRVSTTAQRIAAGLG